MDFHCSLLLPVVQKLPGNKAVFAWETITHPKHIFTRSPSLLPSPLSLLPSSPLLSPPLSPSPPPLPSSLLPSPLLSSPLLPSLSSPPSPPPLPPPPLLPSSLTAVLCDGCPQTGTHAQVPLPDHERHPLHLQQPCPHSSARSRGGRLRVAAVRGLHPPLPLLLQLPSTEGGGALAHHPRPPDS